jgi:hypothetical protein
VSKRFEELARRKQALIEKARVERLELASAYDRIRAPFDLSAMLLRIGRALKTHPLMTAGVSTFVISGLGRKLLKTGQTLFKLRRVLLPLWVWWSKRRKSR